jgi:dTDP-4-amino-4,6-dideoxygalactose transaminase
VCGAGPVAAAGVNDVSGHGATTAPRVPVPSFTVPATAFAVQRARHSPALGDVDPHAWTLPPELAAAQITAAHCQAVIPMAALGRTNGLANAPPPVPFHRA